MFLAVDQEALDGVKVLVKQYQLKIEGKAGLAAGYTCADNTQAGGVGACGSTKPVTGIEAYVYAGTLG